MNKIIVIGGGAAGFFGAIHATSHSNNVTILEAGKEVLTKVKISGGGRCNVTHHCFDVPLLVQNYPRGNKALRGAFSRFQPRHTIEWFQNHGVILKTEADGRMFPITDDSQTIVSCLMNVAERSGIRIRTQAQVIGIKSLGEFFELKLKTGETLNADRVLLATGSSPQGFKLAQQLGHKIIPPVPSLFTFAIKDSKLQELAGVSLNPVTVNMPDIKLSQTGALIFTHWGLSGPAILKLSAWGARELYERNYTVPIGINWLPKLTIEEICSCLQNLRHTKKQISSNPQFNLPKRLWQFLTDRAGITSEQKWAELSKQNLKELSQQLHQCNFEVTGKGVFKEEFVTCGGVDLTEIECKTMSSKLIKNCYFAGEILDIDGITGGFNFQNAWTTGFLAGTAIRSGGQHPS
jgi:predicted Rossmann fold flavoprotein